MQPTARAGERSSESPSRVSRRNRRGSPRCRLRPRGRRRVYGTSRRDRRDEDHEDEERAEHDAVDPAGVGDERQAREQEHREREDVETAIEHDRREASPPGVRSARDPARPEQVADPSRKHVVHRHARHDHLDERHLREAGVRDLPPPRRLQPVDDCRCRPPPPRAERAGRPAACARRRSGRPRGSRGRGRPRTPECRRSPRPQESGCVGCPARRTEAARRPCRERRSRAKDAEQPPLRPAATVAAHPSRSSRPLPRRRADHSRTPGECAPGVGLRRPAPARHRSRRPPRRCRPPQKAPFRT